MSAASRYPKRIRKKRSFTEVPATYEPGNKAVKAAKCLLLCRNRRQGILSTLQIDVVVAIAKFVWIDQFLMFGEYHRKMLESVVWKREMWNYGGAQSEAYCSSFMTLSGVILVNQTQMATDIRAEKRRKEAEKITEAEIYAWNMNERYIDALGEQASKSSSSVERKTILDQIVILRNGYPKTRLGVIEGAPPDIPFQEAEEESWNE